jgi:hypothetical protein
VYQSEQPPLYIHFFDSFNGVHYPRVDGTRGHRFDGTDFKPRELPENAQTPTRRVHAVLGGFYNSTMHSLDRNRFRFESPRWGIRHKYKHDVISRHSNVREHEYRKHRNQSYHLGCIFVFNCMRDIESQ